MSASSINPVQNKVVKSYVDNAIANLPEEQFLDLTKTEFVENFTWSNTTYPGSTNPNLNGKPVLVLALKDEDENVAYSFINLEDLIDVYTGTAPITVSGSNISHANSGATSGTYGGKQSLNWQIPKITVDAKGHITDISQVHQFGEVVYALNVLIPTGQTSMTIPWTEAEGFDRIVSVYTYSEGQPVIVDVEDTAQNIIISIAQPHTAPIYGYVLVM